MNATLNKKQQLWKPNSSCENPPEDEPKLKNDIKKIKIARVVIIELIVRAG